MLQFTDKPIFITKPEGEWLLKFVIDFPLVYMV